MEKKELGVEKEGREKKTLSPVPKARWSQKKKVMLLV